MNESMLAKIMEHVLASGTLEYDAAVALLEIDPESHGASILRRAAHQAALTWAGGKGSVWFAIGLDSSPCPRSCDYCALGEQWGVLNEPWQLDEQEALQTIRAHDIPGVGFITLRATDRYPTEDLLALVRKAAPLKHALLVANVGDMGRDTADALREAGVSMIYHALRLREGVDTRIDPELRLRTMRAATQASLQLAALVDPIGAEHSSEEIARSIYCHKEAGACVSGAMARVPVPGTPKYSTPTISTARLAQVTAVARLAGGPETRFICSHPADEALVFSGANTLVVERGSIPRDTRHAHADWRSFTLRDAFSLLNRAGYRTD
jgi:biotin synthase